MENKEYNINKKMFFKTVSPKYTTHTKEDFVIYPLVNIRTLINHLKQPIPNISNEVILNTLQNDIDIDTYLKLENGNNNK